MTRIRLTAAVLGTLVMAGGAFAEELSLADAIESALADSPQVAAAQAEVEFAEHGAKAAGSAAWPTLGLSGSYGSFSGDVLYGRFIPGAPGDGSMPIGPYDRNATAAVELKQVLYAGGGIDAAKRASGVESRMAAEGLRARRRELSYQVTRAYYELLLAERRAEAAQSIESMSSPGRYGREPATSVPAPRRRDFMVPKESPMTRRRGTSGNERRAPGTVRAAYSKSGGLAAPPSKSGSSSEPGCGASSRQHS